MKTKNFYKKLSLNKKTVSNLNKSELQSIKGGETEYPCPTFIETICPRSVCLSFCNTACEICLP